MVEQTVQAGDDGAVDHHGEVLPTLSKSASRINVEKIESKRRTVQNPGDHPGVVWFYRMMILSELQSLDTINQLMKYGTD